MTFALIIKSLIKTIDYIRCPRSTTPFGAPGWAVEHQMRRREFLGLSLAAAAAGIPGVSSAQSTRGGGELRELRIGYQKTGILVIARQRRVLEERLVKHGIAVKWVEFISGPPLLEAMNVGAVDVGATGDSPPIFAQAAGAAIVYVAGGPINNGQAIIVKSGSSIRSLVDLKGKRIAFTKGSSAHNITIAALEKAGLGYADITPINLSPADAAAAFARDSIDAWAIWDPYLAVAEKTQGARVVANAADVTKTYSFYLANKTFAARYPKVLGDVLVGLSQAADWAENNRGEVAKALAVVTGVSLDAQIIAADRASFPFGPVTDEIVASQQIVADRFLRLGLIPKPIVVRDAVWAAPQS
jgi:sulfonate transport system substrate-binding protein